MSNYPLKSLVQEVRKHYPKLDQLDTSLLKIVKALNKQETYSKVSATIITQLAKLYKGEAKVKKLKTIVNLSKQTIPSPPPNATEAIPAKKPETQVKKPCFSYNSYQVRQRVMKYTNPMRVKILLYYTLNASQMNTKQEGDELLLKTYELDKMLEEAIHEFNTIQELQDHLETTALGISSAKSKMFSVDENLQVAKAIAMSLKPVYETT